MAVVQSKKPVSEQTNPESTFRVDEGLMLPGKYEVTPEMTFVVEVHLAERAGRWVVLSEGGKKTDSHKLVFRMWGYDEMVDLKKKATAYDQLRRNHTIDQDALNRMKVQRLLLSWTFSDDNPRLKLHRVQGTLTDESWANFTKLQANIIVYILDKMNAVLDYNG